MRHNPHRASYTKAGKHRRAQPTKMEKLDKGYQRMNVLWATLLVGMGDSKLEGMRLWK